MKKLSSTNASKSRNVSLGKFLRNHRLQNNTSQMDVSKALGYSSPQFISNWERDLSKPPLKILVKLLDFYGINKKEFIEYWVNDQRAVITKVIYKKAK